MAATTTTRPISGARTQAGPVRLLVIGAGSRGSHAYGQWCLEHPDRARVVAVADPNEERRDSLARQHDVATAGRFRSWREALAEPGAWDAVVIATPDRLHVDPAVRALELGSDVLLEKPIAPTVQELNRLVEAARLHPGAVTVAHVLRYTPFFTAVKQALDEGRVGALQGIQHTENIGYWHLAHSYVRGNWNRSDTSSPMLLAKRSGSTSRSSRGREARSSPGRGSPTTSSNPPIRSSQRSRPRSSTSRRRCTAPTTSTPPTRSSR